MPKYTLFHPDAEILGQAILDFSDVAGFEKFSPVLERHGLTNLQADHWYPAQRWVDVLNEIVEMQGGGMLNFVSMGMRQMELVEWPPEFHDMSMTELLLALDGVYHEVYRGTDVGGITAEVLGDQHVKLMVRSFEPDDLWYGNVYGFVSRFLPKNTPFTIYYDENELRREQGGEHTIIHVTWEA